MHGSSSSSSSGGGGGGGATRPEAQRRALRTSVNPATSSDEGSATSFNAFVATVALTQQRDAIIALCAKQGAPGATRGAATKLAALRDYMHTACSLGDDSKALASLWKLAKAKARATPAHTVLPVVALNATAGELILFYVPLHFERILLTI